MKQKEEEVQNLNINLDPKSAPILYTDMVHMNVTEDGVTIDVCQRMGNTNQLTVVSRIGMSRQHAEKFVKKLSEILALTTAHGKSSEKN